MFRCDAFNCRFRLRPTSSRKLSDLWTSKAYYLQAGTLPVFQHYCFEKFSMKTVPFTLKDNLRNVPNAESKALEHRLRIGPLQVKPRFSRNRFIGCHVILCCCQREDHIRKNGFSPRVVLFHCGASYRKPPRGVTLPFEG